MVRDEDLDFWIKNNYNVLFIGHAGVGKTSIVKEAFERHKLRWKYFSASTLDPWVDFVGVPKEKTEGDITYLDLVRPKVFQEDTIDAIFMDEYNRGSSKIRNAVMELIQFKSINGKKFNNLRLIWAAINPDDDEEYNVEKLDPAQEDRFHIKVSVPYEPHRKYFSTKYGVDLATSALAWWKELPAEQKKLVSPRRLDYALDVYGRKGDIRYVLPESSNVSKLLSTIKHGPIKDLIHKIFDSKNPDEAKGFIQNENNYSSAIDYILKKFDLMLFFMPHLPKEKLALLITKDASVAKFVVENSNQYAVFRDVLDSIVLNRQNTVPRNISNVLRDYQIRNTQKEKYYHSDNTNKEKFALTLANLILEQQKTRYPSTHSKIALYEKLRDVLPAEMTLDEALKSIKFLTTIITKCHGTTITSRMPLIIPMLSHCFSIVAKTNNMTWKAIRARYENTWFPYLVNKLYRERMYPLLQTPPELVKK